MLGSRRIRVLHVTEAMGGGTLTSLHLQVTNLDPKRFQVELAIPFASSFDRVRRSEFVDIGYGEQMEAAGYVVHRIGMRGGGLSPGRNLSAALSLARIISNRDFDIVHTHSAIGGAVGRLGARLGGARRAVYQPHGLPFNDYMAPSRRRLYVALERGLGRMTDVLIAISASERDQALAARLIPEQRIRVIEIPIDTTTIHYHEAVANRLRREYQLPPEAVIVGTAARFVKQKGLEFLVAAAPQIVARAKNVYFVIAGDGRLRSNLEADARRLGVGDRFRWLGMRLDALDVISSFDIFVLPSLWEGLPRTALEAMLLGRPVVATAVTGTRDLIQSSREGILVPPCDSGALADAVVSLVFNTTRRAGIGRAGQLSARRRFGVGHWIKQIVDLYESLVEQSP